MLSTSEGELKSLYDSSTGASSVSEHTMLIEHLFFCAGGTAAVTGWTAEAWLAYRIAPLVALGGRKLFPVFSGAHLSTSITARAPNRKRCSLARTLCWTRPSSSLAPAPATSPFVCGVTQARSHDSSSEGMGWKQGASKSKEQWAHSWI